VWCGAVEHGWYRNCLFPYVHDEAVAGKRGAGQHSGRWIMQTSMDASD
jgi:hypothetical protein